MSELTDSAKYIQGAQKRWSRGRPLDTKWPRYLAKLEDNLFLQRLRPETESEFRSADGSELSDTRTRPAKMRALVSSSALAVNFFDAWRGAHESNLAAALGLSGVVTALRFEFQPNGYPVKPRSPNLDVVLTLADGQRVAVESKFTEPYGGKATHGLSEKYFPVSERLWDTADLPAAQKLADALRPEWRYLDVPQLLKHMLGLASDPEGPARLLYLWYDTGLADADEHRAEVERFAWAIRGDRIGFVSQTYQAVFEAIPGASSPTEGWYAYFGRSLFSIGGSCLTIAWSRPRSASVAQSGEFAAAAES